MNDAELREVLKRAQVPDRGADYWARFPGRVSSEIERRRQKARAEGTADAPGGDVTGAGNVWSRWSALRSLRANPSFALGLAAFCVLISLALGSWKGRPAPAAGPSLAEVRKYFHEIAALFPHQLQAIVFDPQGAHLVLAPEPNLPASPPVYLKICGPSGGCQRVLTFSGQQIRVNGDICDVLADGQGRVLLVGQKLVWSSNQGSAGSGPYRIEAKTLEAAS